MENYFIIEDLPKYIEGLRHSVADYIYPNYTDNLDDYITLAQLQSLVLETCKDRDESDRVLITEDMNENLFITVCDWVYGVGLSRLASQNLVECAWDDKQNCMVFWSPNNVENSNESKNTTNSGD